MTHIDDETELRTRFARAADEIPVAPPPTEDDLRTGADRIGRRRTWGAVAVAAVAGGIVVAVAALPGVGDPGSEEESTGPPSTDVSASRPPERMRLDCPDRIRSMTFIHQVGPGAASPLDVARPYVDEGVGESVRVIEGEDRAYVWILRSNGTARARLSASYSDHFDGWLLGSATTCGDAPLVEPPLDRP